MHAINYQDRLLRYANSGHSHVLQFECKTPKGSKSFTVYSVARHVDEVETESISIPVNTVVLSYRQVGAAAVCRVGDPRPLVVSPRSVAYYSHGTYLTRASKGSHKLVLIAAHLPESSVVHEYLRESGLSASVRGYGEDIDHKVRALGETVLLPEGPNFFTVSGTFYLSMQLLLQARYAVDFGEIPDGLTDAFHKICEEVRARPGDDWSINTVAAELSYSPQYFSRTFKSQAGEGFHSYVQRVRFSQAVNLVCDGEANSQRILEKSGFSSVQAMHEAFRNEIGLLPGDFKILQNDVAGLRPSACA